MQPSSTMILIQTESPTPKFKTSCTTLKSQEQTCSPNKRETVDPTIRRTKAALNSSNCNNVMQREKTVKWIEAWCRASRQVAILNINQWVWANVDVAAKMFHHPHMERLRRRCNHLNQEIGRKFRRDAVVLPIHPKPSRNENNRVTSRMSSPPRTVVIKFKVKTLKVTNFLSSSAKFPKGVINLKCKIFQIQIFCLNLLSSQIVNFKFHHNRATSQPTPTSAAGQAFA